VAWLPLRFGIGLRTVRLISGCVLFLYVALHLVDHSLGNISIAAMEAMLRGMKAVWQSMPGMVVLYAAMATHLGLAFWALYERRYHEVRAGELVQVMLGFCIPVLLANHILSTRVSLSAFGTEKGYPAELYSFWVGNVPFGVVQHVVLVVAWTHGCLGLYFWLRLKPWFRQWAPVLLAAAVLLPALALLGSFQGGRQIEVLAQDPAWRARYLTPDQVGTGAQNAALADARTVVWLVFAAAVGVVLAARAARMVREQRHGRLALSYLNGGTVPMLRGYSVLEASRMNGVPHLSVCGGRGRCSTCRVEVLDSDADLPAPGVAEAATLSRIRAAPGVRLACQLRPDADLLIMPLLLACGDRARRAPAHGGEERYLVMMFVDLRGSTSLAEGRLPYDTVFIVNSFLTAVGQAVVEAGGMPNTMLGDGMLALFGIATDRATAARQALAAVAGIRRQVTRLNHQLTHELPGGLRFGIGVHGGEVIVGDIGPRGHAAFTALGDPVNAAARLESMSKELGCEAVISEVVYRDAGADPAAAPLHRVSVRGKAEVLEVRAL
jgi:adenylate cyclase